MADTTIPSSMDILNRYGQSTDFDPTINRWKEQEDYESKTEDKGTLTFTDMLSLMVAQFQNQTIDNQADTTDMMNQLVQMSSMQAMTEMTTQLKEVVLANVMTYSASLVGKTVTVGVTNKETGEIEELVGVVQGTGTYNGQQVVYLDNGKGYFLNEIMAVGTLPPKVDDTEKPDDTENPDDKVEGTPGDEGEGGDKGEDTDDKVNETQGTEGA